MELLDPPFRLAYRGAHLALRVWWAIRRPATRGALVALWHDGRILLVRSSYRRQLSLPGGYVKRGEDPREAARQELREEVGLELPHDRFAHVWHGSRPYEGRADCLDFFEVTLDQPAAPHVDNREIVWADWKRPADALQLDLVPHLREYLETFVPRDVASET